VKSGAAFRAHLI